MKPQYFVIIKLGIACLAMTGIETAAFAGSDELASGTFSGTRRIHTLNRSGKGADVPVPPARDPFYPSSQQPSASEQVAGFEVPVVRSLPPSLPAFQILGKQEDDAGWAVFISVPDKPERVWVVRQGEIFSERYRISKLAPPLLIIKSMQTGQSKTFDIGKNEE